MIYPPNPIRIIHAPVIPGKASKVFSHVWSSLASREAVGRGYGNACDKLSAHFRHDGRSEPRPFVHAVELT